MLFFKKENKDLERQAKILKEVTEALFKEAERCQLDGELTTVKKDIIEYNKRLHTNGLEKFNSPSYLAAVSYFRTPDDMAKEKAVGAFLLYIEGEECFNILRAHGYKAEDDEDQDQIAAKCAEFCKKLGERLKNALAAAGFADLVMSEPLFGRNQLSQGPLFSLDQYSMMELSGSILKAKRIVLNLTLTTIPK